MKKVFLTIVFTGILFSVKGQTYLTTFDEITPSGHTLQYGIVSDLHGNFAAVNQCRDNARGNFIIPDSVQHDGYVYPVKGISGGVFGGKSYMTSVTIPSNLIYIGPSAFSGCISLSSINLPNTIDSIGESAFNRCTALTTINIPSSITTINHSLFNGCSNLQSINIPNSVRNIKDQAFQGCSSLPSITIPPNIVCIGKLAFYDCANLTTVNYNAVNCTQMGEYQYSSGTRYTVYPVFEGGNNLSSSTHITTLNIGTNVRSIPEFAFYNSSSLTTLTFPDSILTLAGHAFEGCGNVTSIVMRGQPPLLTGDNTFLFISAHIPVYTSCGALSSYQDAAGWSYFTHFIDACITITTSINDFTRGGITGDGNYMYGDSITLTAIPFQGSRFVGWSNGSQDNPLRFVATQDLNLVAAFADSAIVRDTVYVYDTTILNYIVYDTTIVNVYDTVINNYYQYDTTIYNVYDTIIHNYHQYDTTVINNYTYDTNIYNHFRYDTTLVYDTMIVNVYTYDTSIYNNYRYDTVILNTYQYDTTIVYDTTIINTYRYDTTLVNVYDTTINNVYIYDTTIVNNFQYDTIIVNNYVYDTVVINNYTHDTVNNYYHDTINNYYYDTVIITHYYHDTVVINNYIYDTIYLNRYIFDTIYIHDTIYVGGNAIGNVMTIDAKIYAHDGQIVVEGASGERVSMYDVLGRLWATKQEDGNPIRLDTPASGTYLIKVGNHPAHKVVVIR